MKKTIDICAALLLSLPLSALALTTVTETDVSSGGYSAAGGTVTVTGNSDADAQVRTIMNSGSGGTTYKTEIRTESDGVVRTRSEEGRLSPGGRTDIRIGTSSKNADSEATSSGSSFFGAQGFFSAFWKHLRTFFGFF